jgi:hypothetical protein
MSKCGISKIVLELWMENTLQFKLLTMPSFHNYKGTHLVMLVAICDGHHRCITVDIGDAGHYNDGGILSNSEFGKPS